MAQKILHLAALDPADGEICREMCREMCRVSVVPVLTGLVPLEDAKAEAILRKSCRAAVTTN